MRKIRETEDLGADPAVTYLDWKRCSDKVLEAFDEQLKAFGLEVVWIDTGSDEYAWKIEKRSE